MFMGYGNKPVGSPDAPGSGMAKHHGKIRRIGMVLSGVFVVVLIALILWLK